MGFNRIEAKIRAKTSIRQGKPNAMRVSTVYLLLTSLLTSLLMSALRFDLPELLYYYAQRGYEPEEILSILWSQNAGQIGLSWAMSLVLGIYTMIMGFGYVSYTLRLARNEDPGYTHLFDGFVKFWRVLWMNILRGIFIFLWTFVLVLPAIAALFVLLMFGEVNPYSIFGVYTLVAVWGAVACMAVSYRYCLAEYYLLDDPSRTARACITLSKRAMRGWKMERFTLDFSFVGWFFAGEFLVLLLSRIWYPVGLVGMLAFNMWFLPYRMGTVANFYDCVSGRADPFPKGGSDWDDRMKDFNDAFDKP